MDQNPNQSQPDQNRPPQYGPPAGDPSQYPSYGVPQHPPYGPPPGGDPSQYPPQYPPYGYGPPPGGDPSQYPPQYPPYGYGPPPGAQPYPPYAHAGYQPAQKSSKLWLWILLGIIGVSLVVCIAACGFVFFAASSSLGTSIQTQEVNATAQATPDDSGNASPANIKTVAIGQAVTIENVACTLSSVKHIAGDSTATPKAGDEFVVVSVVLTNHSKQALPYDAFNFYVVDATGKAILSSNVVPEAYKQQLTGGTLAPGQSVSGKLVFEVATNDHKQALNWQPSLNVSPQNTNIGAWNLGI